MTFQKELTSLINRYSRENKSNTPDFLLAEYMNECLLIFERIIVKRDGTRIRSKCKTTTESIFPFFLQYQQSQRIQIYHIHKYPVNIVNKKRGELWNKFIQK